MIQKIPLDQVPIAFGKIEHQFVGILVGIISAEIYNRFSGVELPKALSFFSGRRLVPILIIFSDDLGSLYHDVHLADDFQRFGELR